MPDSNDADADEPAFRVSDRRWWNSDASPDPATAVEERKPSYVEQLEQELADRDRRLREMAGQVRAAEAEVERARARIERDAARQQQAARAEFLRGFLDLMDDVDRAVEAATSADAPQALRDGIDLLRRRFVAKLAEQGITRLDPLGEAFDPRLHEALTVFPVLDASEDGRVAAVITPGYLAGDEVLRPARVAVGKLPGAPS